MNTRCLRRLLAFGAMAVAGMAVFVDSLAQDGGASGSTPPSSTAASAKALEEQRSLDVRASRLLGRSIKNANGETLGEFKDFLIDVGARRVDYAVLSLGSALGFGDKLYAYPMSAFRIGGREELVLTLDRDRMKGAPGFVRDAWPKVGDNRYFDKVDQFFRREEAHGDTARAAPRPSLMRATDLIGKNVDDRAGRNAGEVQDLVIDIGRGRLSYAVLDFDKSWSLDNKLLPVPLSALRFPEKRRADLVLTLDRKKLDLSHGFEKNLWPDLNTAEFRNRLNGYFIALERGDKERGGDLSTGSGNTGSSATGR